MIGNLTIPLELSCKYYVESLIYFAIQFSKKAFSEFFLALLENQRPAKMYQIKKMLAPSNPKLQPESGKSLLIYQHQSPQSNSK